MRLRGVGVDIVDVLRLGNLVYRERFRHRWFTSAEREYCRASSDTVGSYAMMLAAKEAAWKAMRIRWAGGVPWHLLGVRFEEPMWTMDLSGEAAEMAASAGVRQILVTTAMEDGLAIAHAFALRDTPPADEGAKIHPPGGA